MSAAMFVQLVLFQTIYLCSWFATRFNYSSSFIQIEYLQEFLFRQESCLSGLRLLIIQNNKWGALKYGQIYNITIFFSWRVLYI